MRAESGIPLINIFRGQPRPQPIEIKMVERHPLESQAFIPLQNQSWLLVVGMPGDEPVVSILQAFRATDRHGVNYHHGDSSHPLLVLKQDQDFLVVDRGGPGENCDEVWFDGASAQIVV